MNLLSFLHFSSFFFLFVPLTPCFQMTYLQVCWFFCLIKYSVVIVQSLSCVDSLWPHGLQHARIPCPSPTPRAYSNSCPLNEWYHPATSSSVISSSSRLQSFPASGSFTINRLLPSHDQSIGALASASVLSMNIQGWFSLGLTGLIFLQFKGLSRVFNTTVQKHQFFSAQLSLWFNSHICTWPAFFMVQPSHLYMTTGKTIAVTIWTFVSNVSAF